MPVRRILVKQGVLARRIAQRNSSLFLRRQLPPRMTRPYSGARHCKISCGISLVNVSPIRIGAPLFDIASHLENAIGRAALRKCVHGRCRFFFAVTAPPAKLVRVPFVAPRKNPTICTTRCLFPFNFGRQPQPGPMAIRSCAKPGDVDYWMLFEIPVRRDTSC